MPELTPDSPAPARNLEGSDALVGRGDIIAALALAVANAVEGRGGVVLLVGEPGIGKTSIAGEVVSNARRDGATTAWAAAWPRDGAPDYWPWIQVLRAIGLRVPPRPGRPTESLPELLAASRAEDREPSADQATNPEATGEGAHGPATDPTSTGRSRAADRFRLFDEVSAVLIERARARPLVLVLDDLQWADPPSLELLEFLARRIRAEPLLVVGTYRDFDVRADATRAPIVASLASTSVVVPLPALSTSDVGRLMTRMLGRAPGPEFVASVQRRTGGNPFFVQQVTRLLAARGTDAGSAGAAGIPIEVREAIERRLLGLSRECVAILAAASVMGSAVSPQLVAQMTQRSLSAVQARFAEAAHAQLVTAGASALDPVHFVHDLVRETLRDGLDASVQAQLHLAAARALEGRRARGGQVRSAEIADHFVQAIGLGAEADAVRYCVSAARDAGARSAYDEAVRYWERAERGLDALTEPAPADVPERLEILLQLADARARAGDAVAAASYLAAAELARRVGDSAALARAALGIHAIGARSWPPDETVIPILEEAVAAFDDRRSPAGATQLEPPAVAGYPPKGSVHAARPNGPGDAARPHRPGDVARPHRPGDVARPNGPGDPTLRSRLLAALARELAWNGQDVQRARDLADRAVDAARATGDPAVVASGLVARHNVVWGPGNAGERLTILDEATALPDALQGELRVEISLLRAADLLELGDPRFRAELDAFVQSAESMHQPQLRFEALVRRATVGLLDGSFRPAEDLIEEAARLGAEIGEPDVTNIHEVQLWNLRAAQGRRGEALGLIRHLYPEASLVRRSREAIVLVEAGDTEGASALVRSQVPGPPPEPPRNREWVSFMAAATDLLVALGLPGQCEELLRRLAPFAGSCAVIGAAISFEGAVDHHLGRLAAAIGRPVEATAHLARAIAMHDRLGATPWVLRSQFELACVLTADPASRDRALDLFETVAGGAAQLGMNELATRSADRRHSLLAEPAPVSVFRREGPTWTLAFAGTTVHVDDAKGLRDIHVLLARPGEAVAAIELVALSGGGDTARADLQAGSDQVLDEQARREIRDRLHELDGDIAEAETWADPERASRARAERDALLAAVARATGLAGRSRRLGDSAERARKAVHARLGDVLGRLDATHPALAAHFRASITTGTWCTYHPATHVTWDL